MQTETSRDTLKEASLDLLKGTGWKPGDKFSFHSVSELMVALALKFQKGEIGCDYPSCGCCADAACQDAINQHPDLGGTPPAQIPAHALSRPADRTIVTMTTRLNDMLDVESLEIGEPSCEAQLSASITPNNGIRIQIQNDDLGKDWAMFDLDPQQSETLGRYLSQWARVEREQFTQPPETNVETFTRQQMLAEVERRVKRALMARDAPVDTKDTP